MTAISGYQLYTIYKSIEDDSERRKYASEGRGINSWLTRVERDIAVGLLRKYLTLNVFDHTNTCQFCGAFGGHVQGCTVDFLGGLE